MSPQHHTDDVSTQQLPLVGDATSPGRYLKRKLLGAGSFGEAWLVERATDQQKFVAKVMNLTKMSSRDKQYALSEIQCLAVCDHPNIIHYEEDAEEENHLIIVMELADSGDLDRQMKARAASNFRYFLEHEVLFLFLQIALALDHVHRHKMLHRDIKGANILLTSSGLIKLGDFGFSRQYEETVSAAVAGTFCGTPYYLSPELWNNSRYSKKADVWSLGILLYEIMALKRPFVASNMRGLMAKVNSGQIPPLPDHYSQELRDLVGLLLVHDPNQRPSITQILEIKFVREGLETMIDTIEQNNRIPEDSKRMFKEHLVELSQQGHPQTAATGAVTDTSDQSSPPAGTQKPSPPSPRSTKPSHQHRIGEIDPTIFFEGPIRKFGGALAGREWPLRYLVLHRGYLILSNAKHDKASRKALNLKQLRGVCPVPVHSAQREFVFALVTASGKSMWLHSGSQAETEKWIDAIQLALGIA